ncbi:MAG: hypothetical protein K1X83_12065 [Oligoflexia bacterium]|nr:hypothetical protein [Oligoflexia bacterium]
MKTSIRARIDKELTSKVGKWFTVREIQRKLGINPATLKPLIMKYAREKVLVRRRIRGTARAVEFSPAARNAAKFRSVLTDFMPYRSPSETRSKTRSMGRSKSKLSSRGRR